MVNMKVIQIHQQDIQVCDFEIPIIQSDEVLIKTDFCGVCGTDILKLKNRLVQKPTVLGHEVVGEVCKVGSDIKDYKVGDKIVVAHHVPCFTCHYCLHGNESMCEKFKKTNIVPGGFAEYICLSAEHLKHTAFVIPPQMDLKDAVFTEPLACCVRNIDRLPLLQNDTIVIMGLGSIGLMMTKLLKLQKCFVIGIDLDEERCTNAKKYGVDQTFTSLGQDFIDFYKTHTHNRGIDGVIFTAGPASLLNESFAWIRNGGFINLFSHLSGEIATIDTAQLYHRELQVITTYSATPDSLKKAFALIQNESLNLSQMLASPYKPQEFSQAIQDIEDRKVLKALIQFDG